MTLDNSIVHNAYDDLYNSWERLDKSYDDLRNTHEKAIFDQTLLMPEGLDEHYERIRKYESYKFTSGGDPGWLLFYATQVLHDLGNYSYGQRCVEFNDTMGILCNNLTTSFAKCFSDYISESLTFIGISNSSSNKMQIMYNWTDWFVSYVKDTNGFGRFPIETLTCRCGDCEDQAMAISFLLESEGYETALCIIHDKNLTKYGSDGLYHVFCVARNNNLGYNGTLIHLNEYPEYGNSWIVLDPAFNHPFGRDPEWMNNYRMVNGTIHIPKTVWSSLLIDYTAVIDRAREIGITITP
jgi:hypothetical protein